MVIKSASFTSNKSIKNQVISFLVAGVIIMTVIISLVTAAGVHQQSRQLMLKNAFQITEVLAKRSVFPILSGSNQNAQDAITHVLGFQSVLSARLLLEDEAVFLESGEATQYSPERQGELNETKIIAENSDLWILRTPVYLNANQEQNGEEEFELADELSSEQLIGYAEVIYSKTNLVEAQTQVTLIIVSTGVISVLILSLIMHAGLRKLFKPLRALAQTMDQARTTGEHLFADSEGAKEVRTIAWSYNNMMEVLDRQDEALKKHRDELEKQVELRTRELVTARDAALIASRHKSEFMANMSHELRTPIQSIIGYGELVSEELELVGNVDLLEDMDKVSKNAQRLLVLINSILDLAKIEAGRFDLKQTNCLLDDLSLDILDTIEPLAAKNNNQFSIDLNTHLKSIYVDKEKLEQVLLNLLSNACKFTENGQISLTIANDSQQLYFTVTDTGIGLSEDQQEYIFDQFRQVDASQSRKFSGTGLGLAISKRFVELMSGSIKIESTLGQGASFTVTLPYKKET